MVELSLTNFLIVLELSDEVLLQSLNFQILCQFRARSLDIQTWSKHTQGRFILRYKIIIRILATVERIFHSIDKIWLKKERILNFFTDVFFLFVSNVLVSSSGFLLSYLMKTWKNLFFKKKFFVCTLFSRFLFQLVLFKYRVFAETI